MAIVEVSTLVLYWSKIWRNTIMNNEARETLAEQLKKSLKENGFRGTNELFLALADLWDLNPVIARVIEQELPKSSITDFKDPDDIRMGDKVLFEGKEYEVWRVSDDYGIQISNMSWVCGSKVTKIS
jgi:hypothetical protein